MTKKIKTQNGHSLESKICKRDGELTRPDQVKSAVHVVGAPDHMGMPRALRRAMTQFDPLRKPLIERFYVQSQAALAKEVADLTRRRLVSTRGSTVCDSGEYTPSDELVSLLLALLVSPESHLRKGGLE